MSSNIIYYNQLLYNQINWFDEYSDKPKGVTRVEHAVISTENLNDELIANYKIAKAKRNLRKYNDEYRSGRSEWLDENNLNELASQMHHIFPANEFPSISDYLENLIALTPTQHFNYAHPSNNTHYIDKNYQYVLLISKTGSIKDNIENNDVPTIYDFKLFLHVLNIGLKTNRFNAVELNDFNQVLYCIELFYDSK